jgi:hypothetical protein
MKPRRDSWAETSASPANPACGPSASPARQRRSPSAAAAATAAAIAPAEVPPMFLKRYSRASDSTALGYTIPLVMPPFMTRSQYLSATLPSSERPAGHSIAQRLLRA